MPAQPQPPPRGRPERAAARGARPGAPRPRRRSRARQPRHRRSRRPRRAGGAVEVLPGETVEPVSAMRRGIAEHMRRSLDTAAHVTSAIEVDLSRVVAAREHLKQEYQAAYGVNPTYLAFIARATVQTMANTRT